MKKVFIQVNLNRIQDGRGAGELQSSTARTWMTDWRQAEEKSHNQGWQRKKHWDCSKQVAQGQSQVASDSGPNQNPSQEAQKQHNQWQASDYIEERSKRLHKWHIQRETSAGTKTCWGKFHFVWSPPAQQPHAMVGVEPHCQAAYWSILHTNGPITIHVQLQQKSPITHTRDIPGDCTTGPHRTPTI